MDTKLYFLGAAGCVTGSQYLIETGRAKVLVDCGLFQERQVAGRNWEAFACIPAELDAVLLTHAHLDHCGLIPRLINQGFKGPVFCTSPTADIAKIVMADSGRLQEEDVRFKWKRHQREGRTSPHPYVPLYTGEEAEAAAQQLETVPFEKEVTIAEGVTAFFRESGHILGAASIRVTLNGDRGPRTIVFSGDIGRKDMPIIRDPSLFHEADYLVMESTYGDKSHEGTDHIPGQLAEVIQDTLARGGNVVVPSFAVERAQDLLFFLSGLRREKKIPHLMVFLDSPMAVAVTEVFRRHEDLFDEPTVKLLESHQHPCDFPGLRLSRTIQESKAINSIAGGVVIIAGSGMCTGGRIKHHLRANLGRKGSTILFVGYQSPGTLGRQILDGEPVVRIHGQACPVYARVARLDGFSAHAGQSELVEWATGFQRPPKRLFLTHGDPAASRVLAGVLQSRGMSVEIPEHRQVVTLG